MNIRLHLIHPIALLAFLGITTLCMAEPISDSVPLKDFVLTDSTPQQTLFSGTARYSNVVNLSFPYERVIDYVSVKGTETHGSVLDVNGKVINPGTLVASVVSKVYQSNLDVAKLELDVAATEVTDAENEMARQRQMSARDATTQKAYDEAKINLDRAKLRLRIAQAKVESATVDLETCFIYAPFDGVVTETYMQHGSSSKIGEKVATLSCVSIMKIVIPMEPAMTAEMSAAYSVRVYPIGAEDPLEGWIDRRFIYSDRIEVMVLNPKRMAREVTPELAKLPQVANVHVIPPFQDQDTHQSIALPFGAVVERDSGHYVWKAVDARITNNGKHIPRTFNVTKVKVQAFDVFRYIGPFYYRAIADHPDLKAFDIVLLDPPPNLKDNDRVVLSENRRMLRDGDEVQVSIPEVAVRGFYVPNAYILLEDGNHYVAVREGSTVRKIKVTLGMRHKDTLSISSPELKTGMKLVPRKTVTNM